MRNLSRITHHPSLLIDLFLINDSVGTITIKVAGVIHLVTSPSFLIFLREGHLKMHLITDAWTHPLVTSHNPSRDEVQLCSKGSLTRFTAVPDSVEGFKFIPAELCSAHTWIFFTLSVREQEQLRCIFSLKLIYKLIWWIQIVPKVLWITTAWLCLAVITTVASGQRDRDQHHAVFCPYCFVKTRASSDASSSERLHLGTAVIILV